MILHQHSYETDYDLRFHYLLIDSLLTNNAFRIHFQRLIRFAFIINDGRQTDF